MHIKKTIALVSLRLALLAYALFCYFNGSLFFGNLIQLKPMAHLQPLHLLWAVLMIEMLITFFPTLDRRLGGGKQYLINYMPQPYDEYKLLKATMLANQRAAITMLLCLCVNSVFGLLSLLNILSYKELILISIFFYTCSLFCTLFWCPLQYVNKNRCCITCRIHNWDFFIAYAPMLFVKSFFTWSLFLTALVVLLFWEYMFSRHPQRFWEGSNKALACKTCTEKACATKSPYEPR